MIFGIRSRLALALVVGGFGLSAEAAPVISTPVTSVPPACDFEQFERFDGTEFRFPAADHELQAYGFVLWRRQPSVAAEPLAYAQVTGKRGKLGSDIVMRDGVRWFQGFLDDCTRVYAEDASQHSALAALDHLAFYGKAVFSQWYTEAWSLIGLDVVVNGPGLEPNHKLYTSVRGEHYPLRDGQRLTVMGIDTRRYAHAKGVGPFFLEVMDAAGRAGLIKYNPSYVRRPEGELVLSALQLPPPPDPLMLARVELPAKIESRGWWLGKTYVLAISHFSEKDAALMAQEKIAEEGFQTSMQTLEQESGNRIFQLQIAELDSKQVAVNIAKQLAKRFEWVGALNPPLQQAAR